MPPTKNLPAMTGEVMTGGANGAGGRVSTAPIVPRNRPNSQTSNYLSLAMQQEALRYATNYGWQVLPVRGKVPATPNGYLDASSDVETIAELFAAADGATGIGARMGGALQLVGLEIDHKHGATVDTFYKLTGVRMGEYRTPTMRTGNGWRMICYVPTAEDCDYGDLELDGKGIALKGNGGQVVLPPSKHPNGKRYAWVPDLEPWNVDVAPVPALVLDRIRAKHAQTAQNVRTAAQCTHHGQYDLQDLRSMLAVLDPWQDGYSWWLSIMMAAHDGFGDDALPLVEDWAAGKPGEVADKWKSFRKAGVTVGTLIFHARAAGWQPVDAEDADIPERWRITADDWRTCPLCAAHHVVIMSDGSVSDHHRWCRNPKCKVYRKRKIHVALRCVFGWDGVGVETVPADNWRGYRKRANRRWRGNWRGVPIPRSGGDRMVLYETASPAEQLDDVLNRALSYLLENDAIRRERRKATDFLNSLEDGAACDPDTMRKVQQALDVLAGDKTQNLSTPRTRRKADDDAQPVIKPERPKPVETVIIARHHHQRAIHDVLNRLNIPWERRAYGGWRTAPLSAAQLLQVKTALVFAVPGAVVPAGALAVGTNAQLSTPWPEDLPHTEREAVLYGIRERVDMQPTYPLRR